MWKALTKRASPCPLPKVFLIVRGSQLHIEKLSLDGGEVLVEGLVDSLSYEEQDTRQGGLLSRLFRP